MEDDNPFNIDQFELLEMVGKGQFGEVYKVKEKETDQVFAAKISLLNIDEESKQSAIMKDIKREIDISSKVNHPAIVRFVGFSPYDFDGCFNAVLITEFLSKGSLNQLIEAERKGCSHPKWNDTRKLITLYGIASAMSYLHSHKILHRDLKPDNILMDDELYPKIADFGLSKIMHQNQESISANSATRFKGTILYSSPEILFDCDYTEAGDVYAYAMISYEIISNEKPFNNCSFGDLIKKIKDGDRPKFNSTVSEPYKSLIEKCWSQEPSERPTFDQITDELKTNPDFITDLIDENEYLSYIDYINEYNTSFDSTKKLISFDEFFNNKKKQKEEVDDEIEEDIEFLFQDWKRYFYGIGTNISKKRAFKYCKKAANKGHVEAMFQTAIMLKNGDGIPKNLKDAAEYFRMAANSGHPDAMCQYGLMLKNGKGVEVNMNESANYFKMAADNGHIYAMNMISLALLKGRGVSIDKKEAAKYLKKSADAGYAIAMRNYCHMLKNGDGIPKNRKEAFKYSKMAADRGDTQSKYEFAMMILNKKHHGDKKEAVLYLKKASEEGHSGAMCQYASMLRHGDGVPVDEKEAAKYLKIAAEKGNINAMVDFSFLLYFGKGVPVDINESLRYAKIAADKGDAIGMRNYAIILHKGKGITNDLKEAAKYYKMAADKNDKESMIYYAEIKLCGLDGLPPNKEEATKYYQMAGEEIDLY